jgi:ribosomal protein S18 acetylase RimI-like enzyme
MGGTDNVNMTGMVLTALSADQLANINVDVAIGSNCLHREAIITQASIRPNTQIHMNRPHLADLMAKADLAIGAGGATTWERMCLGLPSIVMSIAENQIPACKALEASGLIRFLGNATDLDTEFIQKTIFKVLSEAKSLQVLSKSNQNLVDGLGANRVMEVLDPSQVTDLKLRPAILSDAQTYFMWVNDSEVRSNAINTTPVSIQNHLKWFEERVMDVQNNLFVLVAGNLPVGQIRFEQHGEEAVVDYSLDASVRGRGWGKQLIKMGVEALKPRREMILKAVVKERNIASAKALIETGFSEIKNDKSLGGYRHFQLFLPNTKNIEAEDQCLKEKVVSE